MGILDDLVLGTGRIFTGSTSCVCADACAWRWGTGGYFLRHLRGEAKQVFVACSDDYQQLTLWASYYDLAERKARPETYAIADIVEIRSGVVIDSPAFEGPSVSSLRASCRPLTPLCTSLYARVCACVTRPTRRPVAGDCADAQPRGRAGGVHARRSRPLGRRLPYRPPVLQQGLTRRPWCACTVLGARCRGSSGGGGARSCPLSIARRWKHGGRISPTLASHATGVGAKRTACLLQGLTLLPLFLHVLGAAGHAYPQRIRHHTPCHQRRRLRPPGRRPSRCATAASATQRERCLEHPPTYVGARPSG
jgi:hypothetical protein